MYPPKPSIGAILLSELVSQKQLTPSSIDLSTRRSSFHSSRFASKTKPKRSSSVARSLFLCQPYCNKTIVKGNFKTIVQLPKYVDLNEWLAVNGKTTTHTFNALLCLDTVISDMLCLNRNNIHTHAKSGRLNKCHSSPVNRSLKRHSLPRPSAFYTQLALGQQQRRGCTQLELIRDAARDLLSALIFSPPSSLTVALHSGEWLCNMKRVFISVERKDIHVVGHPFVSVRGLDIIRSFGRPTRRG